MWACGDKVLEQRARELRGDPRGPAKRRHPRWAAGRKPTLTPAQRISRGRNSDHRRLGWAAQTKGREENSRSHAKNTVGIYKQFGWAGKRCMTGGGGVAMEGPHTASLGPPHSLRTKMPLPPTGRGRGSELQGGPQTLSKDPEASSPSHRIPPSSRCDVTWGKLPEHAARD